MPWKARAQGRQEKKGRVVAPGRFELPSQDPESRMIDRYTTGLRVLPKKLLVINPLLDRPVIGL